jgi:hypothetical protein
MALKAGGRQRQTGETGVSHTACQLIRDREILSHGSNVVLFEIDINTGLRTNVLDNYFNSEPSTPLHVAHHLAKITLPPTQRVPNELNANS